jgi:hypothetical protein
LEIKNLKLGQVIKNYKELCKILNEPEKTGNAKKAQVIDWERYFSYTKEGTKFIINKIYDKPKEKKNSHSNNNIEYIKIIELLILDELAQSKNKGKMFLSKNQTLKELNMINCNYSVCNRRTLKVNKYTNIQPDTINEFYESANSTLTRNIEKALNNLRKQALIIWSTEIKIHKINTNKSQVNDVEKIVTYDEYDEEYTKYKIIPNEEEREATEEEKKYILRVERETLLELGYDNKQEVVGNGDWDNFRERVNDRLLKERNIAYYYDCYKINETPIVLLGFGGVKEAQIEEGIKILKIAWFDNNQK